MKQLSVCMALITGMLSACGGGGGGSNSNGAANAPSSGINAGAGNSGAVTPPPAVYQKPRQSLNDFESHLVTPLTSSGVLADPYWTTSVITKVEANDAYTQASVWDNDRTRANYAYRVDGAEVSSDETCRYTPAFVRIPGSLTLGQGWDNSAVETCDDNPAYRSENNSKGSVVAIEPVTVPAGTFNAVKTVRTETFKSTTRTSVRELTCWRDTVTGVELKCNSSNTGTSVGADATLTKSTYGWELGGFESASTGRQNRNLQRFAGDWRVLFTGTTDGVCEVNIVPAGGASGTCEDRDRDSFRVFGFVEATGRVRLYMTGNTSAKGFTGSAESPLKIGGGWEFGTQNGSWYMVRR